MRGTRFLANLRLMAQLQWHAMELLVSFPSLWFFQTHAGGLGRAPSVVGDLPPEGLRLSVGRGYSGRESGHSCPAGETSPQLQICMVIVPERRQLSRLRRFGRTVPLLNHFTIA